MEKIDELRNKSYSMLFKQISDAILRNANKQLKENNTTFAQTRMVFLMYYRNKEWYSLKELEKTLQVTQQTVAGTVEKLENKKILIKADDLKDKRIKKVKLTKKGKELGKRAKEKIIEAEEWVTHGLTKHEKDTLYNLLEKVYFNISNC